jgi:hypothetical protein
MAPNPEQPNNRQRILHDSSARLLVFSLTMDTTFRIAPPAALQQSSRLSNPNTHWPGRKPCCTVSLEWIAELLLPRISKFTARSSVSIRAAARKARVKIVISWIRGICCLLLKVESMKQKQFVKQPRRWTQHQANPLVRLMVVGV